MDIREKARELGFDDAGVARVGELPRSWFLLEWLSRGMHGGMAYLERTGPRLDPSALLSGVRSVVCVLKNYFSEAAPAADPLHGAVSRFASGEDYHGVLMEPLKDLAAFIQRETGAPAKAFVDTGPVLEKLWARQAGLGWQGKHTNLVSRRFSSWFFLGEVLVGAELESDPPHERDYCGSCTRCIEACPTGALVAPYVLDAGRCISYLTIEHRCAIPAEIRPQIGNRIFGCDVCLEACPWNRFAKAVRLPGEAPDLAALMDLTREGFRRRFANSPVLRAKRRGLLRNVAVALGNSRAPEAAGPLARGLRDEEPLVRMHAAWGLGRVGSTGARRALEACRKSEQNPDVAGEIGAALSIMR